MKRDDHTPTIPDRREQGCHLRSLLPGHHQTHGIDTGVAGHDHPLGWNPLRQQVWLSDRLKDARIDSKPANPRYFAVVNDEPITIKEYVREAMQLEDRKKIRRVVETLIQMRLATRLLALHGLTLTEGDLELKVEVW